MNHNHNERAQYRNILVQIYDAVLSARNELRFCSSSRRSLNVFPVLRYSLLTEMDVLHPGLNLTVIICVSGLIILILAMSVTTSTV